MSAVSCVFTRGKRKDHRSPKRHMKITATEIKRKIKRIVYQKAFPLLTEGKES